MTNIGTCTGVLGAHGYFQYTGERQKAYKRLDRQLKRRSLEFWAIFWDIPLMTQLDSIMQRYLRHNGVWHTLLLPAEIAYGRVRSAVDAIDTQLAQWRLSLQHKAIWEATASENDHLVDWLLKSETIHFPTHRPMLPMQEMEKLHATFAAEVKRLEQLAKHNIYPKERTEKWGKEGEDGRVLLSAADHVIFKLEKVCKSLDGAEAGVEDANGQNNKESARVDVEVDGRVEELTAMSDATESRGKVTLADEKEKKTRGSEEKLPDSGMAPDKP
ncbi:hypothetical protein EJ02DRAFT_461190 [Clathrospora elynae]|uniref:Uncharacterized protein n=1 Tax=Clathrospora elynae TaxID=706981 RepID=A0A6A5T705_9PLEO|nr:hypothetical protein EJ02DRAFT_461190 [Clathrospora elynae]